MKPGDQISHYRLLEKIGTGAMGEVWLAEDVQLARPPVAVKIVKSDTPEGRKALHHLLREARAAAAVNHPGVITVHEAGLSDSGPYIVMEYLKGETLRQRLDRGPMGIPEAVTLIRAVVDALAELHELGILHRDLKPSNIFLTAHGPKLLDFGLARIMGDTSSSSIGIKGAACTIAPEEIHTGRTDNRSDLWGIGVILYEALTGVRPFSGKNALDTIEKVLYQPVLPPSRFRPEIPGDLDHIVKKLLRRQPGHRYTRAEELIADLDSVDFGDGAAEAPSSTEEHLPSPRLAVLYFDVLSPDREDAYLAVGLTEDLTTLLAGHRGLNVTQRREVLPYRDRSLPPRTLARYLAADYLLLGSVRRMERRARITVQLVRTHDNQVVWSDQFDRPSSEPFSGQAEIALRVLEELQIALSPAERTKLERSASHDPEAFRLYLRARQLLDEPGRHAALRARELLRASIALNPTFVPALAGLARCASLLAERWSGGGDAIEEAERLAIRALALDPHTLEAQLALGWVRFLRGDRAGMADVGRQISASEHDRPQVVEWMAFQAMVTDEAARAASLYEQIVKQFPTRYTAIAQLAACYERLGRTDDALRTEQRSVDSLTEHVRLNPDDAVARALLGLWLVRAGRCDAGLVECDRALELSPDDRVVWYYCVSALVCAGLGDHALNILCAAGGTFPPGLREWYARDTRFASLCGDPRFVEVFGPHSPPPFTTADGRSQDASHQAS
jgi:non-specific serine/threonine protein kinase